MKTLSKICFMMALLLVVCSSGCGGGGGGGGSSGDRTNPTVSSTNPVNGAIDVAINQTISVIFSEAMSTGSLTTATFTLKEGATVVSGTVTCVDRTATFNPTGNLSSNTLYTATIATGVTDLAGNALAVAKTWTFTTGTTIDTTNPVVSFTNPVHLSSDVEVNRDILATFSEAMDPATITGITYTLMEGVNPVAGDVSSLGSVATFNPTSDLANGTLYTATITTGVTDLAGNHLAVTKTWTFTTGTTIALGPDPVPLGTAGNFVILSKAGISTVPNSTITGDIGVSPIDRTAITGFSETMDGSNTFSTSDQVVAPFKVYASDYTPPTPAYMTTAISDMEIAYGDAAGRTVPAPVTELGSGEIGGLVIAPGLYKWGTGVSISTSVTLTGGANDVWIFQISEGLTQASDTSVILAGGALPKNVFWQTFGAVEIGTNAHLEGVVLCQTAIHLRTGASVNGRLMAQTAVTLEQNVVTQPAP